MKRFEFPIDQFQADWIFKPIRSKREVAELLMRSIKLMLLNLPLPKEQHVGTIVLTVSHMSRLFYVSDLKVFSINFPFLAKETDDGISFHSHAHPQIDSKVTSDILSLLSKDSAFTSAEIWEFAEPISDACQIDDSLWGLLRDILLNEDGYIRYDHDKQHENGHFHPVNHLDIFYSSAATFKMGLDQRVDQAYLHDILDRETHCHYVRFAN